MVPQTTIDEIEGIWFPRLRGDGPKHGTNYTPDFEVPPPTRGWSHGLHHFPPERTGSPAYAGMVPLGVKDFSVSVGFPRLRGDGPGAVGALFATLGVPPPTRGWSPDAISSRTP